MTLSVVPGPVEPEPDDDGFGHLPPHDIAAEQAVLGAMMLSGDVMTECLAMLNAGAFFRPAHQMIFGAIQRLAADGKPADAVTVKSELERKRELASVQGAPYLLDLLQAVPVAANGVYYARRLLELRAQRDAGELGVRVQQLAADPSLEPHARLSMISERLDELSTTAGGGESATAAELIGPLIDSLEAGPSTVPGIPSGWSELNRIIPGFRPGEVTVIGGRPGMGKSMALLNIAAHAAIKQRQQVLVVTLEMSPGQYMERLLAAEAGVRLTAIRERNLEGADWDRVARAYEHISQADTLRIHGGPVMGPQGVRAELRSMRRSGKPAQMCAIDYLQLFEGGGRSESRQAEVAGYSRSLKLIAMEFAIPILAGSQLNRGPDLRTDHHPMLADLRESGAVENDADNVILLYRDDVYFPDSPHAGEVDLIVAKNRQGELATATLAFRGEVASCDDLYREPRPWTPTAALEK